VRYLAASVVAVAAVNVLPLDLVSAHVRTGAGGPGFPVDVDGHVSPPMPRPRFRSLLTPLSSALPARFLPARQGVANAFHKIEDWLATLPVRHRLVTDGSARTRDPHWPDEGRSKAILGHSTPETHPLPCPTGRPHRGGRRRCRARWTPRDRPRSGRASSASGGSLGSPRRRTADPR